MKKNPSYFSGCKAVAFSMAFFAVGTAQATDVFNLEGYGPVSRAMGGTGVAYDIGAAAMMANPATLGLMGQGTYLDLGLDVITTDIKEYDTATGKSVSSGNHGNNNGPYFAPQAAFVYRAGKYAFGAGVFAEGDSARSSVVVASFRVPPPTTLIQVSIIFRVC